MNEREFGTVRVLAAALALTGAAWAQPADDPPKDEQPSAEKSDPPAEEPIPDLDDLLGLPKDDRPAAPERPEGELPEVVDPAKADLDRKLTGQEMAEQFQQAVRLMNETSVRLEGARDAGVVTQRMQEDIIRKLDMIIQAAQQQQSRRSSSQSQRNQQQDPQDQPQQQQGQQQRNTAQGENRDERTPPARREGPLDAQPGGHGAAWGALPARVRDALLQGSSDRFSSMYQKMTEEYYRRLAEEER